VIGVRAARESRAEIVPAVVASQVLTVAALPPFAVGAAAWVALAPALWALTRVSRWRSRLGLGVSTLGPLFAVATYGLYAADPVAGVVFWTVAVTTAAGAMSAFAWVLARSGSPWLALVTFPGLWIAAERSSAILGVPWAVALSQARHPWAIQGAAWFGMSWVSFRIALCNAGVTLVAMNARRGRAVRIGIPCLVLVVMLGDFACGVWIARASRTEEGTFRVAAIQPRLASELYTYQWLNPAYRTEVRAVVDDLSSHAADGHPDLLVWPENGNGQLNFRVPSLRRGVAELARKSGATLLLASYDRDEHGRLFNSVFSVAPDGTVLGRYAKLELVRGSEEAFTAGTELRPLPTPRGLVGVVVCIESTLGGMARSLVERGAQLLVVVTSDVAFRRSPVAEYHARFAIFRAVENRRWLVQASNGGPSLLVDPYGVVVAETGLLERGILQGAVGLRDERSLYTRCGDIPCVVLALLSLAVVAAVSARSQTSGRPIRVRAPLVALASCVPTGLVAIGLSIAYTTGALDSPLRWRSAIAEQFERRMPAVPGNGPSDAFRAQRDVSGASGALAYAMSLLGHDGAEAVVAGPDAVEGMDRIRAVAERSGLVVEPTACDEPTLRADTKPLLLEAVPGHFVAVIGAENRKLDVFDPVSGFRQVAFETLVPSRVCRAVTLQVRSLREVETFSLVDGGGSRRVL
jgi:apolipoprotein N-acyltransferase